MTETTRTTTALDGAPIEVSRDDFATFYTDNRDDLFAYVAYLTGDRGLAEDITAEAFERALRKRRLFDPRRGDRRAWLFGIARNASFDELRKRGGGHALELPDEIPGEVSLADRADARLAIAQAMRSLQPKERELIALKFFAGLENAQIAKILRVSNSNAGTMLSRAIARLREILEAEDAWS